MYEDYDHMKETMQRMHNNILNSGIPQKFSPLVFAVTGTGRVSDGIIEVLKQLPHEMVDPDDLKDYIGKHKDNKKIIIS